MHPGDIRRCAARVTHAVVLACAAATWARADCVVPRYQPVRDFADTQRGGGSIFLTVQPADLTVTKLVCLGGALAKRYAQARDVTAFIFISREAAERFDPSGMNLELGDYRGALRAMFELKDGSGSVTITPIGMAPPYFVPIPGGTDIFGPAVYDTQIPLPAAVTPHCRLEISGLCVMAVRPVLYPREARESEVSGEVTISGTFDRLGRPTAAADVAGVAPEALRRATIEHMKSWQLEPAAASTHFQITYVYTIDPSLPAGPADVRFKLPDRVTIRTGPGR